MLTYLIFERRGVSIWIAARSHQSRCLLSSDSVVCTLLRTTAEVQRNYITRLDFGNFFAFLECFAAFHLSETSLFPRSWTGKMFKTCCDNIMLTNSTSLLENLFPLVEYPSKIFSNLHPDCKSFSSWWQNYNICHLCKLLFLKNLSGTVYDQKWGEPSDLKYQQIRWASFPCCSSQPMRVTPPPVFL